MSRNPEIRSFKVMQEIVINGSVEKVFHALTREISSWWGAPMYCTAKPQDFILETKPGGLFYELSDDGEFAVWGRVTGFKKNQLLEFEGPVGISDAVHGLVRMEVEAKGGSTLLKLTHSAIGQFPEATVDSYGSGWSDLLDRRLRAFVEKGQILGLKGEQKAKS
jgi:uncharacterized protein YndB with AHSA1/START domain